ncbi:MAG: hypothetical protein IJ019_02180 [Alphaproteobacteria bacterium]|nr:hypothetical protein [Alphaproteobacteria bacterium]
MKKVFYIVFFITLTSFSSFCLAKDDITVACLRNMREPEVIITTSFGNLRYDNSKSRRTITRMHANQYGGKVGKGKFLNGLSTFEHELKLNFKIRKQTLLSGITCVYPTTINLFLGVGEDPVIYIARDYSEDSCMYNLVLRHEQTHQQINQSVLEYYLPIIKERFLEVVRNNAVVGSNSDIDLERAQGELQQKYLSVLNQLLEEIKTETDAEQAKLDNDKNYDYETQICKNRL